MTKDLDPRLAETPSALSKTLGFEMTGWAENYARVEAPLADHLMNRQGLPHGGVHAALLDTAMGFAGCYTGDPQVKQNALTLSMTVNYLGRATGTRLIAEAHVTGGGKSTYFAQGTVRDDTGTLVVEGSGVFKLRSRS